MASSSSTYCDACGSAQASHAALWIDNFTDALSHRVPMHRVPLYGFLISITSAIITVFGRLSFFMGRGLQMVKLSTDVDATISNRSKLLWQEALRRDMDVQQVMLFGKPTDTFRIRHNGRTEFFSSLPLSPDLSALSMDDKVLFKQAMAAAGIPVPKSFGVSSLAAAQKAHAAIGISCVKPRTGSNGRHTYPNIGTDEELSAAYRSVRAIGPFVTVEEFIEGNLCRATCVGGTMKGFLECTYPTIVGDGVSTIEERLAAANSQRTGRIKEIELDEINRDFIKRQGYTAASILPADHTLTLSYRANSNREYGRDIHPSFIPLIEKAAKVTGLHIVGFDIIIPDPQKPADEQKWGFIESNSLPWIDLHATPHHGEPVDLSGAVWDLWHERAA